MVGVNFAKSVKYLYSLGNEVSAMKLGLENIRKLLAALGDPQKEYLKVQVAGTNGKGSVCAFLGAICRSAGVETGLYTSPHLITITERIKINGVEISEDEFARLATRVRKMSDSLLAKGEIDHRPTFFEQVTAIALAAFAEAHVELAILETGLGGRLDATTAANAEIAAITQIDLDHQEYLGNTLAEIAAEKAAIIHAGSNVVIGRQQPEAMNVVIGRCSEFGITPKTECETGVWAIDPINRSAVVMFRTTTEVYSDASLGLSGRHQVENARVAVLLAEVLRFDFGVMIVPDDVLNGLENARHPGRLEYLGSYLFDGAHNVAGARALVEFLNEFVAQPITLVFGAMKDKAVGEIAEVLFPKADKLIMTRSGNSRAMTAAEILPFIPGEIDRKGIFVTDTVDQALARADELTTENGLVLITGSLYLVGEAKKILEENLKFENSNLR